MIRPDTKSDHDNGIIQQSVQVSPSDLVKRQAIAWDGMAVEIVQATKNEKVEFHFCSPFHLLAVYEQGARSGGDSFVE